ncbi:MAG: choice-of-anchor Q domain-containing protein, partial [Gammaproteobacteria bacterium]
IQRGDVSMANTTVFENTVQGGQGGFGNVANGPDGPGYAPGIGNGVPFASTGTVALVNSIVQSGVGPFHSAGFNLFISTNQMTGFVASDLKNAYPNLGPLQDNGGPVFTHALLAGSSAIDAGTNGGVIFDARGQPRTVDNPAVPNAPGGDGTDIGALEVNHVLTGTEVRKSENDIQVRFTTVSDKTYGVQYRPVVNSGAWTTLPGTVTGTGGIATYTDANAASLTRRFYRLFERTP